MTCRSEYEDRLQARRNSLDQLCQRDDRAVQWRMLAGGVGLIGAWAVLGGWQLPWALLLLPVAMFIAAVIYHQSVQQKKRTAQHSIQFYQRCLKRLAGEWSDSEPTGEEFSDLQHSSSGDLDIFGSGSLFQLLGSPVTPVGSSTLARWLAPSDQDSMLKCEEVVQRQNAVRSLRDQLDLRECLAVIGAASPSHDDAAELYRWLVHSGGLTSPWIRVVATVLGLLGMASLGIWFVTGSLSALIIIVLSQLIFIHKLRGPLASIKQYSERAVINLQQIVKVVAALEKVEGEDAMLCRARSELVHGGVHASETIHRLERLVSQFENMRRNLVIAPIAFLSMVTVQFACAIDQWRANNKRKIDRWFQAVGELEALLAFAQLYYENPGYCFPRLTETEPQFSATQIAHPLLPDKIAVANDVELSNNCRLLLISGSNMSGKSTLLRSVGINTVLAWAGAPVCAKSLTLSRLRVAAAMRMHDSLQTGTSHFFAELKRIRLVVELAVRYATASTHVMFLLDEILSGTNSYDRLVGARGVIRGLLQTGAIGLVTTHDLALSEMVSELDVPARNVHFRDQWVNNEMTFDYQMQDGVVPKSNALSLMRLLGLDV